MRRSAPRRIWRNRSTLSGNKGLQQDICDFHRHDHLAAAELVQDRLPLVRELRNSREAEHAAVALNGMCSAEYAVEEVNVPGTLFELEQSFLDRRQMFLRLFEIGIFEVRKV